MDSRRKTRWHEGGGKNGEKKKRNEMGEWYRKRSRPRNSVKQGRERLECGGWRKTLARWDICQGRKRRADCGGDQKIWDDRSSMKEKSLAESEWEELSGDDLDGGDSGQSLRQGQWNLMGRSEGMRMAECGRRIWE